MPKAVLTSEMKDFIRANYLKISGLKIAQKLGVSKSTVYVFRKKEGLTIPRELSNKWRAEGLKGKSYYTKEQDEFIKENYLKLPVKTIARKIERSSTGVMLRLKSMGLKIPKAISERNKRSAQFSPGIIPANKGKKMPKELREKIKHTWFKKGNEPENTLRDGAITIRHDHPERYGGKPYKHIRISKGKWQALHRYNWEKENGKIPKGMNIIFKDGDTMNCDLSNLDMIGNYENMLRNTIHNYPTEIKKTIRLNAKLNRKIKENEQHN